MDCASCAATVEKRVFALPGVRRATVNFAAGRLDAEHDPGLLVEEIEKAVEGAGYQVTRTEEAEVTPFWRTRRAALTGLSAALFPVGLALSLAGASQVLATGAYATAILVGGLPIFRAAVAGLRARQGHERPYGHRHGRGGRDRGVGRYAVRGREAESLKL